MLYRLLETRTFWPDSLRLILLGGAAVLPELVAQANNLPRQTKPATPLVATTYGLTETASQVATMLPADVQKKPASVGKPLLFTSIKIINENGAECATNEPGEIIIIGPTVMAGYYEHSAFSTQLSASSAPHPPTSSSPQPPAPNPQSPIPDPRSHHSGDIGYLDEDGDLWILQRRSDLIVSGGENVYPAEVEAVLRAHPAVKQVCVVGVPDVEWGQVVAALVVVKDGVDTAVSTTDLLQFCRKQLAGYKCPRIIQFTQQLPFTASGKVHRQEISRLLKQTYGKQ
jgi:O-succinylbenzoic acid--CoA ligase